ncbi:XkdX family protein [Enterococcus diestrammenae]|nr:XkdX family protein [Enterococcus diestrammenae]
MFPSKNDIQFFYDLGIYSDTDLDFYVELGYITAEEKEQIAN